MENYMVNCVHWENVYLMLSDAISKEKKTYLKQLKDVLYKTSRAVWKWTRSKTKLDTRYTEITLQMSFTIILER